MVDSIKWSSIHTWSSPDFSWSGQPAATGGGPPHVINILYSNVSQERAILAPQSVRWRTRYRGQRESYKVNLEIQQFIYDIRRITEFIGFTTNNFTKNIKNIEYGIDLEDDDNNTNGLFYWSKYYPTQSYDISSYDTDEYDGPVFTTIPPDQLQLLNLTGTSDIILRLNRLLKRIENLEVTRMPPSIQSYNTNNVTYNLPIFYNS